MIALLTTLGAAIAGAQVVDNQLAASLERVFPELSDGYIDLNGNGRKDAVDDVEEAIPESNVKDGVIQVQEILDFVIDNYRFIPLEKLRAVQNTLAGAQGAIPEVITLRYSLRINQTIEQREELESRGLYLTDAARREAWDRMSGYIASMVMAYKKEGREYEDQFVDARRQLFSMIEQGYPLPEQLAQEDREILTAIMLHSVLNEQQSAPERVRAAIRTLGRLKAESAVPYLVELIDSEPYQIETIRALGEIGNRDALSLLTRRLASAEDADVKRATIRALGKIGGEESRRLLIELMEQGDSPPAIREATLESLVFLSEHGEMDRSVHAVFEQHLTSSQTTVRSLAIRGLSYSPFRGAAGLLYPLLDSETDEDVLVQVVRSLDRLGDANMGKSFTALLRSQDTTDRIRREVITALGDDAAGVQALPFMLPHLGWQAPEVRLATQEALIRLYDINAQSVVGNLTRALLQSEDPTYLAEGTEVLARVADPNAIPSLLTLMKKPYPEVKKHATWSVYRTQAPANPRIAEELQRLVTSETEPLAVRINAARALGRMGYDSPQLSIWQTLLTVAKLRGEKYSMLRFFAIRALGELRTTNEAVLDTLVRIAAREQDAELQREALASVRKLSVADTDAEETLSGLFRRAEGVELRIAVLEALADMGSSRVGELASPLLETGVPLGVRRRAVYALSHVGGREELDLIIDAAGDPALHGYIEGVLEDADSSVIRPLVSRRLKTESDEEITVLLESLETRLENPY